VIVFNARNLHFLLPEDFAGTTSDALRLLADYHELESTKERSESIPWPAGTTMETRKHTDVMQSVWDTFLDNIDNGGRVSGELTIHELHEADNVMVQRPKT